MHGEPYQNACNSEEIKKLKEIIHRSGALQKQQAYEAVETILCKSPCEVDRKFLTELIPEYVEENTEGAGESSATKRVKKDANLVAYILANKSAWKVSLSARPKEIVLQYFANEACVRSATLRHIRSGWSIGRIGEACD